MSLPSLPALRRSGGLLLGLLLAASTLAACESEPTGGESPDTKQEADTSTGDDTTAGDDATADVGEDVAEAVVDQCQNETDLNWLHSDVGEGQTGRELAREAAGDCGLACLNHPTPDTCAIQCMVTSKGVQLSDGCAGCYGRIVLCTIGECLLKCIDDPQAQQCKDCQDDKGCNDDFYACTGNLD